MNEDELKLLLMINKNDITIDEFMSLYNFSSDMLNIFKNIASDSATLQLIIQNDFAKTYHIPLEIVKRLGTITSLEDLLMTYFFYKTLLTCGNVTENILLEFLNSHDMSLTELYNVVYEFINPKLSFQEFLGKLSLMAESFYRTSLNMNPENKDYIMHLLESFWLKKEEYRIFDTNPDLTFNKLFKEKRSLKLSRLKKNSNDKKRLFSHLNFKKRISSVKQ